MPPEARTPRTEAEQALLDSCEAVAEMLAPAGPKANARRLAAAAEFRRKGLPHRRVEAWHYTDLRSLLRKAAPLGVGSKDDVLTPALAADRLPDLDRARLVVADNHFRADLSDTAGLDGVTILSTADALAKGDPRVGALVDDTLDPMLALNSALALGGVMITVAPGAKVTRPIEIVHLQTGPNAQFSSVRNVIEIGESAELRLIETHIAGSDFAHQANGVTELKVGAHAKVRMARVQSVGAQAFHIASLVAKVGEGADFAHTTLNAGAAVSRNQSFIEIIGSRASVNISGATLLAGRQHADTSLTLTHSAPGSTSRVLFKNAVDGSATGAFQGMIVVAQPAQKTDGRMMTRTLLLSEDATFSQKPELEIYADDVQCGHGATSGRIDDTLLFYFLSRGIPRAEAERLLLQAFLAEGIEAVGDTDIALAIEPAIEQWLSSR